MATGTIEERLTRIEARLDALTASDASTAPEETTNAPFDEAKFLELVQEMQQKTAQRPRPEPTASDWLERNAGIFANDATWDSFMAHIKARSDREYAEALQRSGTEDKEAQ